MFPSASLLAPHSSSDDCKIRRFAAPSGTILLINAWAISFQSKKYKTAGSETYKLVPFGVERRACPGAGLAKQVMGLALESMIQSFEENRRARNCHGRGTRAHNAQGGASGCYVKVRDITVLSEALNGI